MREHSPAPWEVVVSGDYVKVVDANRETVSDLRKATPQGLANACLEAAAPLLLKACRKALDAFGGKQLADCELSDEEAVHLDAVLHLTAAIAEATKEAP